MDNRPEISQACDRVCRRATFLHNRTVRRQHERGWWAGFRRGLELGGFGATAVAIAVVVAWVCK
jgi:hypothetical protein